MSPDGVALPAIAASGSNSQHWGCWYTWSAVNVPDITSVADNDIWCSSVQAHVESYREGYCYARDTYTAGASSYVSTATIDKESLVWNFRSKTRAKYLGDWSNWELNYQGC